MKNIEFIHILSGDLKVTDELYSKICNSKELYDKLDELLFAELSQEESELTEELMNVLN